MGAPKSGNTLESIEREISSAMYALNMYPRPISVDQDGLFGGYLSEIDMWANHAYKHLEQAQMNSTAYRENCENNA